VGRALDGPLAGRRVVGEINAGCGSCPRCAAGDSRHCPRRTVLGILGRPGAFAERLALPTANLLPVPDGLPTEAAVFTEPLAAALALGEQIDPTPSTAALVAGDGRLGLLCAHALAHLGCPPTVAGHHPERASLLPPGARHVTDLLDDDDPVGKRPFDLAIEATGHPEVLPRVLARVRPRGTIVLKTTSSHAVSLDLAPLVVDEQRLLGSRCGRFGPALELLAAGSVPVERLIAARYPLARAEEALAHAGRPGVLKVLLEVAPEA
jgi:threonine dehydrogenase-like Zn-dependent dehydrogenase